MRNSRILFEMIFQEAYALSCRLLGLGFPLTRVRRLISKNPLVHLDVCAMSFFKRMIALNRCAIFDRQGAVAQLNMAAAQSAKARSLPPLLVVGLSAPSIICFTFIRLLCTRLRVIAPRFGLSLGIRLPVLR